MSQDRATALQPGPQRETLSQKQKTKKQKQKKQKQRKKLLYVKLNLCIVT